MTDRKSGSDEQTDSDSGDLTADAGNLSGAEAQQMDSGAGRGARTVPGAEASDEYIEEHVQGATDQAANNSEIARSSD